MQPVHKINVIAKLPEQLEKLREIAFNLRWTWNSESIELFRRLDPELWEQTHHNPVAMMGLISQERFKSIIDDAGFIAHFNTVSASLDEYLNFNSTWFQSLANKPSEKWCIAYFSMEYGVSECIPVYSGGLGVLSGDHMKSASDLGLPLVGVGLLYKKGYFRQYLNPDGWQQESYTDNDFHNMPITLIRNEDGSPLILDLELADKIVKLQIWRMQVGRVDVIFLDTHLEENTPAQQHLTDVLYGGDADMRISQEIVLGIGGIRALKALDLNIGVCHMNEGHSAFLGLERIRTIMKERNVDFYSALETVRASNIFTTHTPVSAGIDRFTPDLVEKYFSAYRIKLGLSLDEFMALGREDPSNSKEPFCMAILAINLSGAINGVSKLHGKVSRRMWKNVWPQIPEHEIGIQTITNGVHYHSWVSPDMAQLYQRYLGPKWAEDPSDRQIWQQAEKIPPGELWRTHERRRERLIAFARQRLKLQLESRGCTRSEIEVADEVLDPSALTIGIARRFASYKRATLIFYDENILSKIVNDVDKPVQIIFAGKAHPNDNAGKELIRTIIQVANKPGFRHRIVFIEDYDINVARYLVQGCDLWLNTPRRLEEASGTSGMKAMVNGALNLSILDGWWDEAYRPGLGWAIGRGEVYKDFSYQDQVEARAIYKLLEQEIIPMFYDRGQDQIPRQWVDFMKQSLVKLASQFSANRMVREYTRRFYLPAMARTLEFSKDELNLANLLAEWRKKVKNSWPKVFISEVKLDALDTPFVGEMLTVTTKVKLGNLLPDDVAVEIYSGIISADGLISQGESFSMRCIEKNEADSTYHYIGQMKCNKSGQYGITVRVRPSHKYLNHPFEMRLIKWVQPIKSGEEQQI